ncbi:hypothetical protein [Streptomyces anulatus]|uniref:hypothetical protein n=1 Tax=Streptomyces anulatus TaxID=1892 RepID=UPI003255A144
MALTHDLLREVLRPAVRTLAPARLEEVEQALASAGSSGRAEAFRRWSRPSTPGRIGRRISGRVRRG